MKLTKEKLKRLLLGAFGFFDAYATLMLYNINASTEEVIVLTNVEGEQETYSYNDASIEDASLSLQRTEGGYEQFVVLVPARRIDIDDIIN